MIDLDKLRDYHEQAVKSANNKSGDTITDLIFLKAAYGSNPECFRPYISEIADSCLGYRVEEGFNHAEKIAQTIGGSIMIPYEPELKILGLWTTDMESRKNGIKEIYWKRANEYIVLAKSGKDPIKNLNKATEYSLVSGRELPFDEVESILLKRNPHFLDMFPESEPVQA